VISSYQHTRFVLFLLVSNLAALQHSFVVHSFLSVSLFFPLFLIKKLSFITCFLFPSPIMRHSVLAAFVLSGTSVCLGLEPVRRNVVTVVTTLTTTICPCDSAYEGDATQLTAAAIEQSSVAAASLSAAAEQGSTTVAKAASTVQETSSAVSDTLSTTTKTTPTSTSATKTSAAAGELFTGLGTRYGGTCTEEDCWQSGACSFVGYDLPAGIDGSTCVSQDIWNNGANCGGCISVTYKGKTIVVMVRPITLPCLALLLLIFAFYVLLFAFGIVSCTC
jgi:hypothetical protein